MFGIITLLHDIFSVQNECMRESIHAGVRGHTSLHKGACLCAVLLTLSPLGRHGACGGQTRRNCDIHKGREHLPFSFFTPTTSPLPITIKAVFLIEKLEVGKPCPVFQWGPASWGNWRYSPCFFHIVILYLCRWNLFCTRTYCSFWQFLNTKDLLWNFHHPS